MRNYHASLQIKIFFLFILNLINITHANNQIAKSQHDSLSNVSSIVLSKNSHTVHIQDKKMAFYAGQFFLYEHLLTPVNDPVDIIKQKPLIQVKVIFSNSKNINYEILRDINDNLYIRKGNIFFRLSCEKYQMLLHLIRGYSPFAPEMVKISLPSKSYLSIRVTGEDYLYIKKEAIDNRNYYSAHILCNYTRRCLNNYVCISDKYENLLDLLNNDQNLLKIRSVATWQYPVNYEYHKEFSNHVKLNPQEETAIVEYVISNALNINQSWWNMEMFYLYIKQKTNTIN